MMPSRADDIKNSLDLLLTLFPGKTHLTLEQAAPVVCKKLQTIRNELVRGTCPFPTVKTAGRKRLVPILGLAKYLDSLTPTQAVPTPESKGGRPRTGAGPRVTP